MFDLGGVIMDIEKERCIDAFTRLGLPDAAGFFGEYSQKGPFMQIEEGTMSVDAFHDAILAELPVGASSDDVDRAFCEFLIGIPVHRLEALRMLRKSRKVYMLSNTNPIMWKSKIKAEFEKEGRTREDYFDGIATSFEAKALKPDNAIFRYALEKFGIRAEETLFLDDSQRNLDAAALMGFKTMLVAPGDEFLDRLVDSGF